MINTHLKIAVLFLSSFSIGQVGIGTENPQVTLDIQGAPNDLSVIDGVIAPRITGEQLKSKDANYTAVQDGAIVYVTEPLVSTSEKTKRVLEKGYYNFNTSLGSNGEWRRMFFSPKVLAGANGQNAHTGSELTISSRDNNTTTGLLMTRSFEIKERSLVVINASCSVSNVLNYNGAILSDGASKAFGLNMNLTGNGFNNTIARDANSFTNSGNLTATGIFQQEAHAYIVLNPGTYTLNLYPFVYARDNTGIRASFGVSGGISSFDIIAFPVD